MNFLELTIFGISSGISLIQLIVLSTTYLGKSLQSNLKSWK